LGSTRWTLTENGTHLTQTTIPVRANGEEDINVIDYVRVSGADHTLLGVWKPLSSRSAAADVFTISLRDDELQVFAPKYGFVVYTMRLDGRAYPVVAPNAPSGVSNVAEGLSVRRIRRTTLQGGKPTLEAVMEVSADGKVMTVTTHTPDTADVVSITVYEKQS
jgi:hypothetical protein